MTDYGIKNVRSMKEGIRLFNENNGECILWFYDVLALVKFSKLKRDHPDDDTIFLIYQILNGTRNMCKNDFLRLKELAKKHSRARILLGVCYAMGYCCPQDVDKAINIFNKEAKRNNGIALYNLGYIYYYGIDKEIDYQKAFEYFKLSAATNYGQGCYHLGKCYYYGQGCEINEKEAIKYYKLAIKQKRYEALVDLGIIYFSNGKYDEAFKKFTLSSSHNDKRGIYRLGVCYESGLGCNINLNKAYDLYIVSAVLYDYPFANYRLARCLYYGLGTKVNLKEAYYYLSKASEYSIEDSLSLKGYMELNGLGTKQDYSKAIETFEKGFNEKCPKCAYYLSLVYDKGLGVEVSKEKSIEYLTTALKWGYDEENNK